MKSTALILDTAFVQECISYKYIFQDVELHPNSSHSSDSALHLKYAVLGTAYSEGTARITTSSPLTRQPSPHLHT